MEARLRSKDTKSKRSRHSVPLPEAAVEVLKAHRAAQNAIRLQTGGTYATVRDGKTGVEYAIVFPEPATGAAWDPGKFSGAFRRAAKRLKVGVTFHRLRHSYATIALRAKVPMKLVSDILGHSTLSVTADTYTHILDDMTREAGDRVGGVFDAARRRAQ